VNDTPTDVLAYFLGVSPGWVDTMGIPLISGRDFRAGETSPGTAIVNQAFVKQCFGGVDPVGKWFSTSSQRFQVAGVVADARYRDMREPITPTAYVPINSAGKDGALARRGSAAILVRTSLPNALSLAPVLRREIPRARPEFFVSNVRTQGELVEQHTVRERLLAKLALFFATVALLLAAIGLYGVLDYSVLQRRREIGVRIAIGAPAGEIARMISAPAFAVVVLGASVGLGLGLASVRYIQAILYHVQPAAPDMMLTPAVVILAAAALAAVPPALRAMRIDPATMLRSD
jgi:ABC-type lipoprotein release transport system permease subunit